MQATREILWNVNSIYTTIGMYGIMVVSLIIAAIGIFRHAELWNSGKKDGLTDIDIISRIGSLIKDAAFQRKVSCDKQAGLLHTLIYIGFLVLLFTTTMVFIDHDLGIRIYQGDFYLFVTLISDIFGFGLLIGCLMAYHRRYIQKATRVHNRFADSLMLNMLVLLVIQGFLLEGLRIHATKDLWANYSPIGNLVAKFFWPLSYDVTSALHAFIWWFHTITVFSFIALIPYSKFFHIVASSLNLFFKNTNRAKGAINFPGDLEKRMQTEEDFKIGLGTIKDYSFKELLDLDACTSCGRCQEVCPAYNTGKPLSPKWMILDTRNHALQLNNQGKLNNSKLPQGINKIDQFFNNNVFFPSLGLNNQNQDKSYRSDDNKLVQDALLDSGSNVEQKISGEVIEQDVFWSCTTCMACVEACPVGINHLDQIIGNRQHMALMEGNIPSEAQKSLRAIENRGNPFGAAEDRIKWLTDLDVKILKAGDSVDYLYWVGCVSAYDPRKQKIAKSLVKLMHAAGLDFGILGTAEGCTGDPARRLGEENLFQTLAKNNIETLKSIRFKNLVANCPHCFNTIKNEYPQLGNLQNGESPEIIHHSQLLKRLLADGKLEIEAKSQTYTFHDPCYLGRYNDEYQAPREVIKATSKLPILEMEKSENKAMCCGAGGGHFWMDLKIGSRVNVLRTEQAAATGSKLIATACPFCMQMMEDGVKLTDREGQMEVKDIAEVLAEGLISNKHLEH